MSVTTSRELYTSLLQEAETHIFEHDYDAARRLLQRAHGIGHTIKADHLKAHRALVRLGFLSRNPLLMLSQSALLVLAWIFD